jgi:pimeloyl-ACP methyl ester carboxylesterase
MRKVESVRAGVLDVAYERHGTTGGVPVMLLHGFPYDVRAYDEVVPPLAERGLDVVVPYLRGYGPTRFVQASTMRSGQQAALAHDLVTLLDALGLGPAILVGYDWGGRAACLVAMLWPERAAGLVTVGGYNVQDIAHSGRPAPPELERPYWYQYYLNTERGRAGLAAYRVEFARQLWREWSPGWAFAEADFQATAGSFDNPDFVDVVVHSYRHRYGAVAGDPAYQATEDRIAAQPAITVPTVIVDATRDGLGDPERPEEHARHFSRIVAGVQLPVGHNVPQEAPGEFAHGILRLLDRPPG